MMRGDHLRLIAVAALALLACLAVADAQLDVHLDLANDPRFNKMLPEHKQTPIEDSHNASVVDSVKLNDIQHSEIGKPEHFTTEDPNDDYMYDEEDDDEDDYDIDAVSVTPAPAKKHADKAQAPPKKKAIAMKESASKPIKMVPIKGNDQNTLEDEQSTTVKPTKSGKPRPADDRNLMYDIVEKESLPNDDDDDDNGDVDEKPNAERTSNNTDDDDDDAYDNGSDEDDDVDDYSDQVIVDAGYTAHARTPKPQQLDKADRTPTGHTGCPMNCLCQVNFNGFMVANCDRLDAETMHFDSSITDLEVLNVPPKYVLLFGARFFERIGLANVSTIKIANTVIQNIHPDAFRGLDQLYSVNLTDTGLDMLPPDLFAHNAKLRILSLSGNDLHAMQQKSASPFVDYMLNAPSIEELYLSRCNIKQLLPTAFSKLENVVFISLAENQLVTLPHQIFNHLHLLEEVDLTSNSIENLPRHIFDNTSLSMLYMRYNEMSTRPAFVVPELTILDLSYNKLRDITDMMFTDLPQLNNLMLKGNAIRKVHHSAFAPLKDLRHIDLSFNDLEQVSALMFLENSLLDTIRLNDNAHLKKLPMEGFASTQKEFNVYLFDASNCDLSDLGENTFSTMPRLNWLNLSWNNIESLGGGLFSYLSKLAKLDLSNNLITDLGDLLFLHNRNLRKLNLAGNPLEKLSPKVFLPTKQLVDLDLSDCNLKTIWSESFGSQKSLLKNLKSLNVSNNEIVHIRMAELAGLEKLSVFDLSNNKLVCDKKFRDLMKWLETKKMLSGQLRDYIRETADLNVDLQSMEKRSPWEEYSMVKCKEATKRTQTTKSPPVVHEPTTKRPKKKTTSSTARPVDDKSQYTYVNMEDVHSDDDGDDEADGIVDSVQDKANEKGNAYDDYYHDDTDDDDDSDEATDDAKTADNADDDEDEADDDDDDEYDYSEDNKEIEINEAVVDHGVKVTEAKRPKKKPAKTVVDSVEMRPLSDDIDDGDDDDDDLYSDEDETNDDDHFERIAPVYLQYGYLMPIAVVALSVFVILVAIAKIVCVMMHRRGERYRQALLASKNSIVYQKLSEEIGTPQTPKFHRYAPIQQV